MGVLLEFAVVTFRVVWSFVLAGVKWLVGPKKEKNVAGQVCLVTGAGGGLGRHLAVEFSRRGATLVLWDIDSKSNEETADMVRQIHQLIPIDCLSAEDGHLFQPEVHTYVCDVGKREQVYLMAKKVQREVGDVDILINNAGVVSGRHLLECPDHLIERTLMVNCHALFWTCKAFLPRMMELNHGHMVTVTSTKGLFSMAGIEDYCASKCGAVSFHESLSHELKAAEKDGIKMTLVCPSLVDTNMFSRCQNRKEIAPLLATMRPEECIQRAMRAILTEEPMICTPRSMYMVNFLKAVLPFDAVVCMYRFLGAEKCMHPFLQHQGEMTNNNESRLED